MSNRIISAADFNFSSMKFTGTLQVNTPVSDGAGGQTDSWSTLVTTRVSLNKRSGRLSNGMGKYEYQKNYVLVCRYQGSLAFNADSRWLINGEVYKVEDWEQVDLTPFLYTFELTKNQ